MDALTTIVAFGIAIVVHEFGHYIFAVWTGMKVDRFSVFGIGQPIARLGTFRGTEFVIGAVPFGAYVQIHGMEAEDDPEAAPDPAPKFRNQPAWARMLVLFGGPFANYVFASVALFGLLTISGLPGDVESVEISEVSAESAAEKAGIEPGDRVVAIDGKPFDPKVGTAGLIAATQPFLGKSVDITVSRGEETLTRTLELPDEPPALGVRAIDHAPRTPVAVGRAAQLAVVLPWEKTLETIQIVRKLITREVQGRLMGPVGIVKQGMQRFARGLAEGVEFTISISIALGFFNLLPIPALDGGRITFIVWGLVSRRPVDLRKEETIHAVGILLLLVMLAVVTFFDIFE